MKSHNYSRRGFIERGAKFALGAPFVLSASNHLFGADATSPQGSKNGRSDAKVAIVSCAGYGPEVRQAFDKGFDLLGGIGTLVRNKVVTVKVNLTGTNFSDGFLKRPPGETYMTHFATVMALGSALFKAGAKRVRFVESTNSRASLEDTLALANWDVKALSGLGNVEFENTRNLGKGKKYSHLRVPGGGHMFSTLDLNHSYEETDVMVSLAKLKQHITAGVTLSMKNLFGITPNALYGEEAGNEDGTAGRGPLHAWQGFENVKLPGLKEGKLPGEATLRVPRIVADICAARPIHLGIIDGITSVSGGEGPWCAEAGPMKLTTPGVLIFGLNPVSTDAVGTAVMGYPDPRATRPSKPFDFCDNHLLLAEQAGIGTADLSQIDVRGLTIEKARYPYV